MVDTAISKCQPDSANGGRLNGPPIVSQKGRPQAQRLTGGLEGCPRGRVKSGPYPNVLGASEQGATMRQPTCCGVCHEFVPLVLCYRTNTSYSDETSLILVVFIDPNFAGERWGKNKMLAGPGRPWFCIVGGFLSLPFSSNLAAKSGLFCQHSGCWLE